jgi:uncharacterized protein YhfF
MTSRPPDGRHRPRSACAWLSGPAGATATALVDSERGAGDRSPDSWLRHHESYFRRFLPTIGLQFDPDMPTMFERFEVLHRD